MKKIILFSIIANLLIFVNPCVYGQSVGVSGVGSIPNASALLDVDATGMTPKGLLMPRIALTSITDVTTINSPANSLIVYNTGTGMAGGNGVGYYFYCSTGCTPTGWKFMAAPSNGPGTSGQVLASQGSGNPPQWLSIGSGGGQGGKGTALGSSMMTAIMDSIGLFTPHTNNCAAGEAFINIYGGYGYCIEQSERGAKDWARADSTCLSYGKRLPEAYEWQKACDNAGALSILTMTDNWEWAGNFPQTMYNGNVGVAAALFGGGGCGFSAFSWLGYDGGVRQTNAFRCVH